MWICLLFQDREFVEMEAPFNGAPKRAGSPSPLTSPAHSTASRGGLLMSCCGPCCPQRYQVRGRRILASTTSISDQGPPSTSSHSQQVPSCSNVAGGSGISAGYHQQHQPPESSMTISSSRQNSRTLIDDLIAVPSVAFNVPGETDRSRRNLQNPSGSQTGSPYNETRV